MKKKNYFPDLYRSKPTKISFTWSNLHANLLKSEFKKCSLQTRKNVRVCKINIIKWYYSFKEYILYVFEYTQRWFLLVEYQNTYICAIKIIFYLYRFHLWYILDFTVKLLYTGRIIIEILKSLRFFVVYLWYLKYFKRKKHFQKLIFFFLGFMHQKGGVSYFGLCLSLFLTISSSTPYFSFI